MALALEEVRFLAESFDLREIEHDATAQVVAFEHHRDEKATVAKATFANTKSSASSSSSSSTNGNSCSSNSLSNTNTDANTNTNTDNRTRINVWYSTGTVGTYVQHARQGKLQLFRRNVSLGLLSKVFRNPRVNTIHTDYGYHVSQDSPSGATVRTDADSAGGGGGRAKFEYIL
jgi:hypothetical protein